MKKTNNLPEKTENRKTVRKDSIAMFILFIGICVVLGMFITQGRKKRNQLEEVKQLPYHSVKVEDVKDGIYSAETVTSFLYLQIDVEVKDHKLKRIRFDKMNGKGSEHLEDIAKLMLEGNTTLVSEMKSGEELETLVLMSCVDSALWMAVENKFENEKN